MLLYSQVISQFYHFKHLFHNQQISIINQLLGHDKHARHVRVHLKLTISISGVWCITLRLYVMDSVILIQSSSAPDSCYFQHFWLQKSFSCNLVIAISISNARASLSLVKIQNNAVTPSRFVNIAREQSVKNWQNRAMIIHKSLENHENLIITARIIDKSLVIKHINLILTQLGLLINLL